MNFDVAFEKLIGHEGGYVNDARDPGGETKYGISKRAYPDEDIAGITLEYAKQIYRRDYWDAVQAEYLPDAVRFDLFDAAVNSGVRQAVKWLQLAAKAEPDWLIVLDRGAAVGEEGQSAEATLKSPLVEGTNAWKAGHVVYLPAAELYIGGGGYGALTTVIDALIAGLSK